MTSRRYAQRTDVGVDRSRNEIERILRRYGAEQFLYGWEAGRAVIGFRAHDRQIRFELPLPDREEYRFTPSRRTERSEADVEKAWEQACRQAWRALKLVVQAKLEAVEAGIAEFEDEFLAYIVLPGGGTVSAFIRPQLAEAYVGGRMPSMLPAAGETKEMD